jgi:hypothetical protein
LYFVLPFSAKFDKIFRMIHIRNAVFAAVLFALLFGSCTQKSNQTETGVDSGDLEVTDLMESFQFISDKQIAVVFGYSYNGEPFVPETLSQIEKVFGVAAEGGLVLPLVFPYDFTSGRISLLYDKLAEHDVCGLIVIGAPNRTHAVLARLQDSWGGEAPAYPVIMLAPQDDVLGIEAGADLVLDFAAGSETDALGEQVVEPSKEMTEILFALIRYLYTFKDAFDPLIANVTGDVLELLDTWEITPYIDSETGLYAINHFVVGKGKVEQ